MAALSDEQSDEQLAQRAQDVGLLDERQLQAVWSELSSRSGTAGDLQQLLLRRELLTNYQIERLQAGHRDGFFYGDYKVLYVVGAGTFARVFRAAHRETNKLVAIKVLRRRFSGDKEQADCFCREGQLAASLKHPNIVPVYEVYSKGTTHFIAMEFVEGRNLREFLKVRNRFEPPKLILDVANGLDYSFKLGISHRDIKASNILVSSRGRARLVDFGLAGADQLLSDDALAGLSNPRTIDYAGLERSSGVRRDDSRSDVFFVGCIYYHMLTGIAPLTETRDRSQRLRKSRFQDIPPILESASDIPLATAMIVNKAIEFNPERRYQTPAEMVVDLMNAVRRLDRQGGTKGGTTDRAAADAEGLDENGQPRTLLIVESDMEMQNTFRDGLKRKGYRVLMTNDPERAIGRFEDDPNVADLVLFSTFTLGQTALEGFNRFGQNAKTKKIPAILLLHEAHGDWTSQAEVAGHRTIAQSPIKLRELRAMALKLLKSAK